MSMNEKQYNIVSGFLKMGAAPEAIAKSFKIKVLDVMSVQASSSYAAFLESRSAPGNNVFGDFNSLFGL